MKNFNPHRIVVFDRNWHGHHPTYIKLITEYLLKTGREVWLFCQYPEKVKTWLLDKHPAEQLRKLRLFPITGGISKGNPLNISWWTYGIKNWIYARNCIKKASVQLGREPQIVLFLKLEDFAGGILNGNWIDLVFPYQWCGLFIHLNMPKRMRCLFVRTTLFQPFSLLSSKGCCGIGTLQEDCISKLRTITGKPIIAFPDFTDDARPRNTPLVETIKRKARGRKIIGLIGRQDQRKGSFLLLEIAKRCKEKPWFFLFVGRSNHPVYDKDLIKLKMKIDDPRTWENCFFHFDRIPDEREFNGLINVCDILFVAYHNFPYSSNILTKAALFQKTVLVSSGTLLEKRVNAFGIGMSCSGGDIHEYIDGIEKLTKKEVHSGNFKTFLNVHSKKKFYHQLEGLINCRMKL